MEPCENGHKTTKEDPETCVRCGYEWDYYYGGGWHEPIKLKPGEGGHGGHGDVDYPSFRSSGSGDPDYPRL